MSSNAGFPYWSVGATWGVHVSFVCCWTGNGCGDGGYGDGNGCGDGGGDDGGDNGYGGDGNGDGRWWSFAKHPSATINDNNDCERVNEFFSPSCYKAPRSCNNWGWGVCEVGISCGISITTKMVCPCMLPWTPLLQITWNHVCSTGSIMNKSSSEQCCVAYLVSIIAEKINRLRAQGNREPHDYKSVWPCGFVGHMSQTETEKNTRESLINAIKVNSDKVCVIVSKSSVC